MTLGARGRASPLSARRVASRASCKKTKGGAFFSGFSWHTKDPTCLLKCMAVFRAEQKSQMKRAIAWHETKFLADGVFLKWRAKGQHGTAYNWFARVLAGKLKESEWQAWLVRGHRESFDPHVVAKGVGLAPYGVKEDEAASAHVAPEFDRETARRWRGCHARSREAATSLPKRSKKAEGPLCSRDAHELPMRKVEAGLPAVGAHVAEGAVAVNAPRNAVVDSVLVGDWAGEARILAIVAKALRDVAMGHCIKEAGHKDCDGAGERSALRIASVKALQSPHEFGQVSSSGAAARAPPPRVAADPPDNKEEDDPSPATDLERDRINSLTAEAQLNILRQGVRAWLTGVWKTKPEPEKQKRIAEILKGLTEQEKWNVLLAYVRAHFQKRMVQPFGGLRAERLVQITRPVRGIPWTRRPSTISSLRV